MPLRRWNELIESLWANSITSIVAREGLWIKCLPAVNQSAIIQTMPINQQLKDYVTQQTKLGASKDTIKSTLIQAGWNENDVVQAIAESESGTQDIIAPLTPTQPAKPAESFATSVSAETNTKPAAVSSSIGSDAFKTKNEPVFQPANQFGTTDTSIQKPQTITTDLKDGQDKFKIKTSPKILTIALGVVSVVLLAGNVYFYSQSRNAASQVASSASTSQDTVNTPDPQIATLTADKENLAQQIASLNKTVSDMSSQLAIFALPESSSTTSTAFDVSGKLGGGGKLLYSLTTSKNILLFVKNSKDAKVDAALKALFGSNVQLAGTHQPESNYLTVETINGKSPDAALQSANEKTAVPPQTSSTSQNPASAPKSPDAAAGAAGAGTPSAAGSIIPVNQLLTATTSAPATGATGSPVGAP